MNFKLIYGLIFFLVINFAVLKAESQHKALSLEIRFTETPANSVKTETVICDTLKLALGEKTQAFCGNLSLDLTFTRLKDSIAEIEINRYALPPAGVARFFILKSPLDVPYIEDSILTKNGSVYKVFYTPLKEIKFNSDCEYNHFSDDDFYPDPSINFEIYFIQNSLGDINWNSIRDYLESELKRFDVFLDIKQPGKTSVFLYPCSTYHYVPYKNQDFGIHPAKNLVLQEYDQNQSAIASVGVLMNRFYRLWGYAPRMVVEGCAYMNDFHFFYMKEYKKESGLYDLEDMFVTKSYDELDDPHKKRMEAASFMYYLLRSESVSTLKDIYQSSTDLTLGKVIEEKTGQSLAELKRDWNHYIDTITIKNNWFVQFANRELNQRHFNQVMYLLESAFKVDSTDQSTILNLFGVYFQLGKYEKAAEILKYAKRNENDDRILRLIGNMYFAAGSIDSALSYYHQSKLDPKSEYLPDYKRGLIAYYSDDFDEAAEHLSKAIDSTTSAAIRIDARLYLGRSYQIEGKTEAADSQFIMAYNYARSLIKNNPDDPLANLRTGQSALYQGNLEGAETFLKMAEFIENRPFYLGQVYLSLGQLYDLKKDRKTAERFYNYVLEIPSAYTDRQEAEKYLSKPFEL